MEHLARYLLIFAGAAALGHFLLSMIPNLLLKRRPDGRAGDGLVIFVEGIRWLSVPWDCRPAHEGLRRAGFTGRFVYWKWHACWRAWLALPVLMNRSAMDNKAARLAEFIASQRRRHPGRPIYLMGCSCGAYVSVRALELLPPDVAVDSAALLAGAVDSRRNLSPALSHVKGRLVITSSAGDWMLLGLGTYIFGTADRRHGVSIGLTGPRRPADRPADQTWPAGQVTHIRWRPGMIFMGHMGGHFTSPAFLVRHVLPAMGFGRAGKTS